MDDTRKDAKSARFSHIERALEEGVDAVSFGPLKRWSQDELRALIRECGELHEAEVKAIEEWYKAEQFKPAAFFSDAMSKQLLKTRDEAVYDSLARTSEMCAVAMLFIEGSLDEFEVAE